VFHFFKYCLFISCWIFNLISCFIFYFIYLPLPLYFPPLVLLYSRYGLSLPTPPLPLGSTLLAVITLIPTPREPSQLVSTLPVDFVSGLDSWPLKIGPIRCPETSVNNYHTTPRNNLQERRRRKPEIKVQNKWFETKTHVAHAPPAGLAASNSSPSVHFVRLS
jgi:hypothetical protein